MLGKFTSTPRERYWDAMKHLLRYLQGTRDYGLFICRGSVRGTRLEAWSDADWGRDLEKRRYRSGVLLAVNNIPIVWSSKLQTSVALSIAEAEFAALCQCVRQVTWIWSILNEVEIDQQAPTPIYQDILGAISCTQELQGWRIVKHEGIKYNYIKEAVQDKEVEVQYAPSQQNKADSLTKALVGMSF